MMSLATPISLLPSPGKHQQGGRYPGVLRPPTVRLCWGFPHHPPPCRDSLYFCPQLLSPPETSRDPRVPPAPFPQVSNWERWGWGCSRDTGLQSPGPVSSFQDPHLQTAPPPAQLCLENPPDDVRLQKPHAGPSGPGSPELYPKALPVHCRHPFQLWGAPHRSCHPDISRTLDASG